MKKTITLTVICVICMMSCQKKYTIEERAMKQLPIAIGQAIEDFSRGAVIDEIQDAKTIYVNDSTCILQCSVLFTNPDGSKRILDYRYTYLFDRIQSQLFHSPVFLEGISNTLCMPDDIIRQSRRDVKVTGESVYEESIGACHIIRNPFDLTRQ